MTKCMVSTAVLRRMDNGVSLGHRREIERGRTCKAGTVDVLYSMIRHQEPLLPPHEYCAAVAVGHREVRLLKFILHMLECIEPLPMHHIFRFIRTPVLRQEAISAPNNLRVEIRREFRPVICQPAYPQISAEERRCKINILPASRKFRFDHEHKWEGGRTTMVTLTS